MSRNSREKPGKDYGKLCCPWEISKPKVVRKVVIKKNILIL